MKLSKQWLWGIRFQDGTYLHLEGDTIEEAVLQVAKMSEVKKYIPLKCKRAEDEKAEKLTKFLNKKREEI